MRFSVNWIWNDNRGWFSHIKSKILRVCISLLRHASNNFIVSYVSYIHPLRLNNIFTAHRLLYHQFARQSVFKFVVLENYLQILFNSGFWSLHSFRDHKLNLLSLINFAVDIESGIVRYIIHEVVQLYTIVCLRGALSRNFLFL